MTARLRARWSMLSLRERGLILIMAGLLAVVLVWLGLIRPVQDGLAHARAEQAIAVDRAGRIGSAVATLRSAPAAPPQLAGELQQVVAQSAAEAGFTLDSANQAGPDRMTIAIGAAKPTALFAWLGGLEARGVVVETIIVDPGAGGTVLARATLRVAR